MRYCNHCRVHIRGKYERCVLCGNILSASGSAEEEIEIFPEIPPAYESHLAIRIMIFVTVAAVVASFAVRMIFPTDVNWPLLVLFGLISVWLSIIVILRKRYNMPKTIVWQVSVLSALSVFWDWQISWRGWSLDYFIPSVFAAAILVMYITAKVIKLGIRDYVFYALLSGLFGIIPILFILLGWVSVSYPSVICASASLIFLSALFIFQGENIKKELNKRMHL